MLRVLVLSAIGFSVFGCNKLSVDQCEKMCRKYAELKYEQSLAAKTVGRSPEEAKSVRESGETRWAEMQKEKSFLLGLDNCVTDCRTRAGTQEMKCMDRVSTLVEADKCLADE